MKLGLRKVKSCAGWPNHFSLWQVPPTVPTHQNKWTQIGWRRSSTFFLLKLNSNSTVSSNSHCFYFCEKPRRTQFNFTELCSDFEASLSAVIPQMSTLFTSHQQGTVSPLVPTHILPTYLTELLPLVLVQQVRFFLIFSCFTVVATCCWREET